MRENFFGFAVHDQFHFAAFAATPEEPTSVGVVILPDVRGLYRFYVELAERFAEAGHHAIAIDYFGRTAGVAKRDDEFEYREHTSQTTAPQIQADVAAAIMSLVNGSSMITGQVLVVDGGMLIGK